MGSKHTQGPWKAEGWENLTVNSAAGNTIVACPGGDGNVMGVPKEEMKANARLIAAAPDMFDVLERLVAWEKGGDENDMDFILRETHAILNKIKGA